MGSTVFTVSRKTIGYALNRAWVCILMFQPVLFLLNGGTVTSGYFYTVSLAFLALIQFLSGRFIKICIFLYHSRTTLWIPCIITAMGTVCAVWAGFGTLAQFVFFILGGILTGIGSGLMQMGWGIVYGNDFEGKSDVELPLVYAIATFFLPISFYLGTYATLAMALMLLISSTYLLAMEFKDDSDRFCLRDSDFRQNAIIAQQPELKAERLKILRDLDVRVILASIVFSAVVGVISGNYSHSEEIISVSQFNWTRFFSAVLVAIILIPLLKHNIMQTFSLSYKPVMVFMSAGCALIPFLGSMPFVPLLLAYMGYFCFEVYCWLVFSTTSRLFSESPIRTFGYGRGGVCLGVLIGNLACYRLSLESASFEMIAAISLVCIVVMVLTYTMVLPDSRVDTLFGQYRALVERAREDEEIRTRQSRRPFHEKCERFGVYHDISGRAFEVMELLLKGYTAAQIGQELFMSKGTVNTHSHRIYQKLGIHKRQELIDMVEHFEDSAK